MKAYITDTNVPVAANGKADQAGPQCVLACIDALEMVRSRGLVVLDTEMLILHEYMSNLSLSGQPGPGDAFMKWAWTVQADARKCERVRVHPVDGSFQEFPDDPALQGFHRDDRKFVAVALASKRRPQVLNATDSDWHVYRGPLEKHGVRVRFLCPGLMRHSRRRR